MGGGAVWSRVARLATTVSPAVRTASPSTSSCSFCKLNASLQAARQASSSKMHACACSPETTPKGVNVSQRVKSMWDSDEWEFAEEEEKIDHLVFGPLPSRQEVEEATTDLQNALRLGLLAPACDDLQAPTWGTLLPVAAAQAEVSVQPSGGDGSQQSGGSNVIEEKEIEEISRPVSASRELDWMEPPPIRTSQNALQARGRSPVQEAFYQFENNPEVQGMVVSLATDPNIWGAVMANKEIQEFRRKLQGEKALFVDKTAVVSKEANDLKSPDTPNFFERCHMFWQSQVSQFMDVLNGLISMFKANDKKNFAEEGADFVDRTVKSCTVIALIVLFVVILKRLSVQAA